MARYTAESKRDPEEVVEMAVQFFSPGGVGLEVKDRVSGCATFEGGGGHVVINVCKGKKSTEIDLETREWDYRVKEFMKDL